jgi:hypothetical protein
MAEWSDLARPFAAQALNSSRQVAVLGSATPSALAFSSAMPRSSWFFIMGFPAVLCFGRSFIYNSIELACNDHKSLEICERCRLRDKVLGIDRTDHIGGSQSAGLHRAVVEINFYLLFFATLWRRNHRAPDPKRRPLLVRCAWRRRVLRIGQYLSSKERFLMLFALSQALRSD